MNVGIIVFSRTGNTLSVAERVRDACLAQGHTAVIERVHAEDEDPNSKKPVRLNDAPDLTRFDAVLFGAPVEAFSLCPIMKVYLSQLPQIEGKRIGCFVTQHFPKPWLGGTHAVKQMRALCRAKGADAALTGIVNWTSAARGKQIEDVAAALGRIGK